MKHSKKVLSLIMAVIMVLSVLPLNASAGIVPANTNSVDELISIGKLTTLLDTLVSKLNRDKGILYTPVFRIVFLAMNNDDINATLAANGVTEVTTMSGAMGAKVLVNWLDTYVLPDLQAKLDSSSAIQTINDNFGALLQVKIGSVQDAFDTISQLDNTGVKAILLTCGDLADLNVSDIKNADKVSSNYTGALDALFEFLNKNIGIVNKVLDGTIKLGVLNSLKSKIAFLGDLPLFLKSMIYKLIDKDAKEGKFEEGKMGGDWATSPYADYTADQMLAAALIKLIDKSEGKVEKKDCNDVLSNGVYGLLDKFAPTLYANFAVKPLNDLIDKLNAFLADNSGNATLLAQFNYPIPAVDEHTFDAIFDGSEEKGFLGQLNNILVLALKHVCSEAAITAAGVQEGSNAAELNANLERIGRYLVPILKDPAIQAMMGGYALPEEVTAESTLPEMATYILKPFFEGWFASYEGTANPGYLASAVESATTLPQLAALAVYFTARNGWLNLNYDFSGVADALIDTNDGSVKKLDSVTATDVALAAGAGIAIGAITLPENAEKIHFTASITDPADWQKSFNEIENWGLDFVTGLPAVARVHNLRNQNGYDAFYKLDVILNELLNFSFLNGAGTVPFKLELGRFLKYGLLEKLYKFDLAGIVAIFERNGASDNILKNPLNSSVIKIVDRILTALFDHSENRTQSANWEDAINAPGKEQCTHEYKYKYDYCTACGAYYAAPQQQKFEKTNPTHQWLASEFKKVEDPHLEATERFCNLKRQEYHVCAICGTEENIGEPRRPQHTFGPAVEIDGYNVETCTICGYEKKTKIEGGTDPTDPTDPTEPTDPIVNILYGDVDGSGEITPGDARLALRISLGLMQDGDMIMTDEMQARADVDGKDGVQPGDARLILRKSLGLVDEEWRTD